MVVFLCALGLCVRAGKVLGRNVNRDNVDRVGGVARTVCLVGIAGGIVFGDCSPQEGSSGVRALILVQLRFIRRTILYGQSANRVDGIVSQWTRDYGLECRVELMSALCVVRRVGTGTIIRVHATRGYAQTVWPPRVCRRTSTECGCTPGV